MFTQKLILNLNNQLCSVVVRSSSSGSPLHNGNVRMGFLGTGKIAQAVILGLIKKEKLKPEQIYVSDSNQKYLNYLRNKNPLFKNFKINFAKDNADLIKNTNAVMYCVKPNDMPNVLRNTASHLTDQHLIMSIVAGVQLDKIEQILPKNSRVVRIMTNITALVHQACSVYSRGTNATQEDAKFVQSLLEAIGICENEINEDLMNVVTALSGSGPAYMVVVLDALADGGVKMGLSRPMALRLAAQTMLGTSKMIVSDLNSNGNGNGSTRHIAQIKEEVASPAGTTIYGISELENARVRAGFINCIEAATNRAKELNK